jgi:hypothetical protein
MKKFGPGTFSYDCKLTDGSDNVQIRETPILNHKNTPKALLHLCYQ